jgi:phytoene desaturase (3,4-didehydrolycopene-forming)
MIGSHGVGLLLFLRTISNTRAFSAISRTSIRRRASFLASATTKAKCDEGRLLRFVEVLVVGGGVGGLAIASRIAAAASAECKVTILEKNGEAGGRCGSFDVTLPSAGIFRHERGPSLLLLPNIYSEIFQETSGKTAAEYGLIMKQCKPAYTVIFEDGEQIDLGFPRNKVEADVELHGLETQSRRKMDKFEPNGAAKWDEYMRTCEAFLDCGLPNFIEQRLDLVSFPAFLREALRDFGKAWPLKPHSDVLDAIFTSDKMKALASFQDLYVGLEPYRSDHQLGGGVLQSTAPAVFGLLAAIECHPTNPLSGVFAAEKGFRAVTQSLERLAIDLGVDICYGKTVTSVTNDGVYYTDDNDGTIIFKPADLIVVNADLPYATKSIVNQPIEQTARYDWDDKYRYSCGVIAFHWSVGKALEDLNTHNVFLSANSRSRAQQSWASVRGGTASENLPFSSPHEPFNFYVHRASKTDQSAAPEVSGQAPARKTT